MSELKKALIIDDDADLSVMIGEIFRSRQISFSVANSILNAHAELQNQKPSVIVLDNTLPDGKGSEFVPYINKTCPDSKIFLITGDYDQIEEDIEGITLFIKKPFSLGTLRSIIDTYI